MFHAVAAPFERRNIFLLPLLKISSRGEWTLCLHIRKNIPYQKMPCMGKERGAEKSIVTLRCYAGKGRKMIKNDKR
ncbi:MAG: hypothetical protein D3916_09435 [Candidatus Electrothrix sp. MAN1_4]|nr:hypothetical protein [Candidatus Electrothrix sp. MAN1_4]